ncbi:MAG: TlpA family protein disulfide reductase [Candidatus Kapabacteria bacterium]|nr:TlpA family protein disulfide reductase [Candidatus Kapabacteria bacterium]
MKRLPLTLALVSVLGYSLYLVSTADASVSKPASTVQAGPVYAVNSVTAKGGSKAVEFTWLDASGKDVSFSSMTAGKVVLLNVWATWCPPCRREIPDIVQISDEMAAKGVVVIGVSLDDKGDAVANVRTFSEKNGVKYMNVVDAAKKIASAYGGIQAIPTTFIIDRQGNVVQKIVGSQSKEAFVASLQKAL